MQFTARVVSGIVIASCGCVIAASAEGVVLTGSIVGEDSGATLAIAASIWARNETTGELVGVTFVKTDTAGYRLVLPEGGRYELAAMYHPFWYDDWNRDNSFALAERVFAVTARPGTTVQNVTLPEPVELIVRVVDASGNPIGGAPVHLSRMRSDYEGDWGAVSISKESDSKGRCSWMVKPNHEVWVSAFVEGYTLSRSDHFQVSKGGTIPEITLTLRQPGTITATLVDENGRPMANQNYKLRVRNTQGADLRMTCANTDANGRIVAPDFLVRDRLVVSVESSSGTVPDLEMLYEGPADRDLDLGAILVSPVAQP